MATLHFEVLLKNGEPHKTPKQKRDFARMVEMVLRAKLGSGGSLKVGNFIVLTQCPFLGGFADNVRQVELADYEGPGKVTAWHYLGQQTLKLHVYAAKPVQEETFGGDHESMRAARMIALPSEALKDEWATLTFEDEEPYKILHSLSRALRRTSEWTSTTGTIARMDTSGSHVVLLHGPPGTGKSTMCRALAQKLSIRHSQHLTQSVLIDVSGNALLSQLFGESAKIVHNLFGKIKEMAADSKRLVCVVMDEVECIVGRRDQVNGTGCQDDLRATNAVLLGLDQLRQYPNVVIFCTSNLTAAIDQAFLDRVTTSLFIPLPTVQTRYEILRRGFNESIDIGLISSDGGVCKGATVQLPHGLSVWLMPSWSCLRLYFEHVPNSIPARVLKAAKLCEGFSGRVLSRLPLQSIDKYLWEDKPELLAAVGALETTVTDMLVQKRKH